MATTGAITLSSSTATTSQLVTVTLTLTNGGTVAVNVTSAIITWTPTTAPAGCGVLATGPGQVVAVPGSSGTLALSTGFVPYSPAAQGNTTSAYPSSETYTIGATALMSDGSTVTATTATLTVSANTVG